MSLYRPVIDEDNPYIRAGRIIEPKQRQYISKMCLGKTVKSPDDEFGENAKENMCFDFFSEEYEILGGMWDSVLEENGEKIAVFEMKTTNVKNERFWRQDFPQNVKLQAAFYAYLMHIDSFYIVASFVGDEDYDNPENFCCNDRNTLVMHYSMRKDFREFEQNYIGKVLKWWNDHVETGISPQYDNYKDRVVLAELRDMQ